MTISAPVSAQEAGAALQRAELTPEQSRVLALTALRNGNPQLAAQIGAALVQRDPGDSFGHGLIAAAALAQGDTGLALREARRAHALAATQTEKHDTARLAAQAATAAGRLTLAQFWLRRTAQAAPTEAERRRAIESFRAARALNPWRGNLSFSLAPSSNVNGGAESALVEIDGRPEVGLLNPEGQALSGWALEASAWGSYTLSENAAGRSRLTLAYATRQVTLSKEAQDKAPDADAADFGYHLLQLGAARDMRLRPQLTATLRGDFGRVWTAGETRYSFTRLGASLDRSLGDGARLGLQASREWQFDPAGGDPDLTTRLGISASGRSAAGQLSAGLSLGRSEGDFRNDRSRSLSLTAGLRPALPEGTPVLLDFSAGLTRTDYPDYVVGFLPVPGGREDRQRFFSAALTLPRAEAYGFAPVLTLELSRTQSNVSRFDRSERSLSLGIVSVF